MPDLAHNTPAIRSLLKKGNAFIWGDRQQQEFEEVKKMLTSKLLVRPFDPKLPTELLTDASKLLS